MSARRLDASALRDWAHTAVGGLISHADEINRLQKVLETANVKLAAVASNVLGKSGRDMLEAIIAGAADVEALVQLARGRLRAKLPELRQALEGRGISRPAG